MTLPTRLLTIAAVLILALAQAPRAGAYEEQARDAYKKGLRAFRAGNTDEAFTWFRAAADTDPGYPYPFLAMGRIRHELFNQETRGYLEAARAYDTVVEILELQPPSTRERALYQTYYYRGLLYLKGGEYEKALASLEQFLLVEPDFDSPENLHNAIGIALYYLDQYDKAVEEFRRAITADPKFAEARFNLRSVFTRLAIFNEAQVLGRAGELELALEKMERLKEFAPRYLPGRHLEGKLCQALGHEDRALRVYAEMLGAAPRDPLNYRTRVEMAKILKKRERAADAAFLLGENLRLFPDIGDERLENEVRTLLAQLQGVP